MAAIWTALLSLDANIRPPRSCALPSGRRTPDHIRRPVACRSKSGESARGAVEGEGGWLSGVAVVGGLEPDAGRAVWGDRRVVGESSGRHLSGRGRVAGIPAGGD